MAWLNATPKPPEGSKRAKAGQGPTISRLEQLKKSKLPVPLPPNPAPHIVDWLVEIGLTEAAGMGAAPISWQAIHAWQVMTGAHIAPWEARLLRRLSVDYLAESRRAESENCPPPWRAPVSPQERDLEVRRLQMVLG